MKKPEHSGPGGPSRARDIAVDSTMPATPPRPAPPIATAPLVAPGARVHNYIVEHLIGEGGMGAVWRVRQRMLKVPRAMKVLKPGVASVERFEEEMAMLAMVTHHNVVKLIDSGVLPDGSLFYVMEYVEGRSLEADIAKHRGRRPQWEYIREVLLQICDGLAAIHERGIIHRDMKPANCMLSPDLNESVHVKIVDLGVARRSSFVRLGSTSDGMFIGSAAYASPEQAAGETASLTYGSDVYSVGIMLYELITGVVPHVSDGPTDRAAMLRRRVVGTMPQLPSLHVPPGTIPPEIDEIIARALQPDPRDRFQSIVELADAIRQTPDLPRQLRRLRPSQSLPQVAVDALASDSSPGFAQLASQSSPGLRNAAQSSSELRLRPSAHMPASQSSSAALRVRPPTHPPAAQSSSELRVWPSAPSPASQSSPDLTPVSAPGFDISTLIAPRLSLRPSRLALVAGVLVLAAVAVALPGVHRRLLAVAAAPAVVDEREPAAFARARSAIQRLGLRESEDVQTILRHIGEDPRESAVHVATAKLLEAELVLTRAFACQIAVALGTASDAVSHHAQTDPTRAAALLRELPPTHAPAAQARVHALLRLIQGRSFTDAGDPHLTPGDRRELAMLAGTTVLWRKDPAVPAELIASLERIVAPSTLVRSILALALWRVGEDARARRVLVAILETSSDQPAARGILDAILRAPADEPSPETPADPPPAPAVAPSDATPLPRSPSSRPLAERFKSLDEQIAVGCQRVRKGDRSGVRVLMDALSQGAEFESDFNLCNCLGEGFDRQKAHDVALPWYRRALAIDPDHPGALAGAARAAVLLERPDQALEFYRRLFQVAPENAAARAYLARYDTLPVEEVGPLLPIVDDAARTP